MWEESLPWGVSVEKLASAITTAEVAICRVFSFRRNQFVFRESIVEDDVYYCFVDNLTKEF